MSTYLLVREGPATVDHECRWCGVALPAGETLVLVIRAARWLRDPDAQNACGLLCLPCRDRLGDRVRLSDPKELAAMSAFVYRGKEQPSW